MILSHRHRFIFIKGVKVAGTSVEMSLSKICGPEDIVTPISPADERSRLGTAGEPRNYSDEESDERAFLRSVADDPVGTVPLPKTPFYNHMTLAEVLKRRPEAAAYDVLFVERSPYQKVISFANWSENRRYYDQGGALPQKPTSNLEQGVDALIANGAIDTVRNIDRYRDRSGEIASEGWRYESLAASLNEFFRQRGVAPVELGHAKRGFDSARLDIQSVLRRDQIDFINDAFAEEFETFGYAML